MKNSILQYSKELQLDLDISDDRWHHVPLEGLKVVAHEAFMQTQWGRSCYVGVHLMNDAAIQAINQQHRQQNKPTNVLSFKAYDESLIKIYPEDEVFPLGDIMIAFETTDLEARQKTIPFLHHFYHLFVHGLLHLLGHDHEEDGEAEKMESLEINILNHFNIFNPYKV